MFDESPDAQRIITAATMAAIHEDIVAMPIQYDTLVGDMESSLSGGQKQGVLLARALYREPRILVMDEGASHLDAQCDGVITTAIARMGIARIFVAHRMETVLCAPRRLTMQGGRPIERPSPPRDEAAAPMVDENLQPPATQG